MAELQVAPRMGILMLLLLSFSDQSLSGQETQDTLPVTVIVKVPLYSLFAASACVTLTPFARLCDEANFMVAV